MTEGYSQQRVQVGPAEWATFAGREVERVLGDINHLSGYDLTVYETPDEGLKLHVKEWRAQRATDIKPPREGATQHSWAGGGLFNEEEAARQYPGLLQGLLKRKQDKEELGL